MIFDSFNAVLYTSIFLLPGLVILSICKEISPTETKSDGSFLLSCLAYSIFNCAIWSFAYSFLLNWQAHYVWMYWFVLVLFTLLSSGCTSIVITKLRQGKLIRFILSKVGLKIRHSVPTAWDYVFSQQKEAWVIVRLINGDTVYGRYGSASFSSSNPAERDLYLEAEYELDKNSKWTKIPNTGGVLITHDQIATVEIWK